MYPFDYPNDVLVRKHGPSGYANYVSFRPWQRDEFCFRCVYCLRRELWMAPSSFQIDHLEAVSVNPEAMTAYDNLFYACPTCNSSKSDAVVPNPGTALVAENVRVHIDGRIVGLTIDAQEIIDVLGLDEADFRAFRRRWIEMAAIIQLNPDLFRLVFGFPDSLPDLEQRKPPQNSRPDEIGRASCRERVCLAV